MIDQSQVNANARTLPLTWLSLVLLALTLFSVGACSAGASSTPTPQLQVDAENWPVKVLELGQTSIALMKQRGEVAYLTRIAIHLPDVNQTSGTNVSYEFYSPAKRKRLSVSYINTDVSISAKDMEIARRAGVDKVFKDAQAAALAPHFSEDEAMHDAKFAPAPLPGAKLGLKDAYALARKEGLQRVDTIFLSVNDKDPAAPQVMWTFSGKHTREDSQAIHIDALTGAYIDEDLINDLSRAERAAQQAAGLAAIRAFLRQQLRGGGGGSGMLTPEAAAAIHEGGQQQEHGYYFDGLHDYTLGPASDCAARGGTDGGPASFGGNYCY